MSKEIIQTNNAPSAIGTYSQAVKVDKTVYVSGQIPLDPNTMELVGGELENQIAQIFKNLSAIATAAGGNLQDFVKLNVYLTDMNDFAVVNTVMAEYIQEPYPARAAVEVSGLPKGVSVEIEGVLVLD